MSQVAGPATIAPSGGSRTIVLRDSQPREDEEETTVGVLQLRATSRTRTQGRPPRVTWTEDVVDNEHMGKKKTKICCIFHKQKRYDESSSSDSDSDSDSDSSDSGSDGGAKRGGRLRNGRRHSHPHPHDHNHNQNGVDGPGSGGGSQATRDGGGGTTTTVHELSDDEYEPNAYERQPGRKRKKKGGEKGKKAERDSDPDQGQPQSEP
ncbi:hypothetical protein A7U60_g731 [Sanghuangporus baumii]|uniref:Type 1 phosphatases regulator n=1 Tax=Sanghuangporus baumii TaxID=108892 RepID=A0A9Q5I5A5_SANBA|nr:hypothetical protein A7U60_g731 [Sanghuangporus baumii]